jgi:hypothetical protein
LAVGEAITIATTETSTDITAVSIINTTGNVLRCTSGTTPHGFVVGESITTTLFFSGVPNGRTETATITAVGTYTFDYKATKVGPGAIATGFTTGVALGDETHGYNGKWTIVAVPTATSFTFTASTTLGPLSVSGTVSASSPPDVLYNHSNPSWVWSDAVGGETQVYFAGYVKSGSSKKYSGCIYRSDMPGASITSATQTAVVSATATAQPWVLNTPIQALPMSPDEYPTCIASYLNFIFIGTNRGIRMCQTLSIYDPTATQSGDLKSGPLIPNILQPVTLPVTAIVGDGRYVWFAWSNYDASSTGLGKLDLGNFIAGDPLTPAYASDLMVTGQGAINSLDWDPNTNTPVMAVQGLGVYGAYATNSGGNMAVSRYVPSGSITSGVFDYGISEPKIPVYFDFTAVTPYTSSITATDSVDGATPTAATSGTYQVSQGYPVTQTRGRQFSVTTTLNAATHSTTYDTTPTLQRWVLKSWPAVVSGTSIMLVISNYGINSSDGMEVYRDPYDTFTWIENLRWIQDFITYTEGPLSVTCVVEAIDLLPHKLRDVLEGGYEGDMVVTLKTMSKYVYTPVTTTH